MSYGKAPSQTAPTALGVMLQASTYGMSVPVPYGRVRTPVYAIYGANLRQEGSSGKFGKSGKKGGPPGYAMNVDFLIGCNPIGGVYGVWFNQYGRMGTDTPDVPAGVQDFNLVYQSGVNAGLGVYELTITDPHFAGIVNCVVLHVAIDVTVNDYGSSGPRELVSADSQRMLFNAWFGGPDPTNSWVARQWPYVFLWNPSMGPTIRIPAHEHMGLPVLTGVATVYYSVEDSSNQNGLAHYRLAFEPQLGDGDSGQPILYPMYAGVCSPDIDCGASATLPGIKLEVQGKFPLGPIGDADFVDMIEDTVKSGLVQQSYAAGETYGLLQNGVNCYDYPGIVETKYHAQDPPSANQFTIDHPLSQGDLIVVFASAGGGTFSPSISDTAGNAWTTVYSGQNAEGSHWLGYGCWYTFSKAWAAGNTITAGMDMYTDQIFGLVIKGVDSFDASAIQLDGNPNNLTLTTTAAGGQASLVLAFLQDVIGLEQFASSEVTGWSPVLNQPAGFNATVLKHVPVRQPGSVGLQGVSSWAPDCVTILLAFKQSTPQGVPMALGDIVDLPSLELTRNQCHASSLQGSLSMTSQKSAGDWLKLFYQCANAAPVWSGFKLKSIPWSEVSALGWGVVYYAPTGPGPIADLDVDNGDFVVDGNGPPITVERTAQTDAPNIFTATCYPRLPNYDATTISQPVSGAQLLYGVRKADPITLDCVVDAAVARKILMIAARRASLDRNTYKFTLPTRRQLFEAMDLVTITDRKAGIVRVPVRFRSVEEDDKYNLACEASLFIYGENAPDNLSVTGNQGGGGGFYADPGSVNAPIVFQPVPRLLKNQNQPQVWIVVSGGSASYGGCLVFVSTDGGLSYNEDPIGSIQGNAVTGFTTADWPASNDPDSVNSLAVDLTESNGILESYSTDDENNFTFPFYVAGGGDSVQIYVDGQGIARCGDVFVDGDQVVSRLSAIWVNGDEVAQYGLDSYIPYELGSYSQEELTATSKYTIEAGGGNYIRRAAFGAPFLGEGVDHPSGSRFCMLNPLGAGMLQVNLDPRWIGVELHLKFCAYNIFGANLQPLSEATDYTYTPITHGQSSDYSQDPVLALSQPGGTFTVEMAQVSEQFNSNPANYNARSFTVPDPGSTPTWYYVTIFDPGMVGDTGGGTNLTAFCETSAQRVGVPGYTFIGAIQVTHLGGGGDATVPGGWPQILP
jgi:Putative phage tail protein